MGPTNAALADGLRTPQLVAVGGRSADIDGTCTILKYRAFAMLPTF